MLMQQRQLQFMQLLYFSDALPATGHAAPYRLNNAPHAAIFVASKA